jgi:hypothetical protein
MGKFVVIAGRVINRTQRKTTMYSVEDFCLQQRIAYGEDDLLSAAKYLRGERLAEDFDKLNARQKYIITEMAAKEVI